MLLHAMDVAHLNPFLHVRITSPDTDAFLFLIYCYPQLQVMVLFESGNHKINIGAAYEIVGPEKSSALLVFHAFTGCDYTSKFNGKPKAIC